MIINFRTTKAFLTRFLILASILGNIYAVIAFNAVDRCDASKEVAKLELAKTQYVALFGEAE